MLIKIRPPKTFWGRFVCEQVAEEATASDIVSKVKKFGETTLFQPDAQMGQRK